MVDDQDEWLNFAAVCGVPFKNRTQTRPKPASLMSPTMFAKKIKLTNCCYAL